jgi:hypothetical protein
MEQDTFVIIVKNTTSDLGLLSDWGHRYFFKDIIIENIPDTIYQRWIFIIDPSAKFIKIDFGKRLFKDIDVLSVEKWPLKPFKRLSFEKTSIRSLPQDHGPNFAVGCDLSCMFSYCKEFNGSLGNNFDTTNVVNMSEMFSGATIFNQPLGNHFNTSNVTDMS